PEFIQHSENLSNTRIELSDRIATWPHCGRAAKSWMRHARHVDVVRCEVEKKRFVSALLDEFNSFLCENVGHVFVGPPCRFTARHVPDAADATDDRVVVTVRQPHREQVWALCSGGFVTDFCFVINLNRVSRVESDYAMILNIHTGRAITRGGHEEAIIKANF